MEIACFKRNLAISLLTVVISFGFLSSAYASSYLNQVWVCNEGNVDLHYLAFATNDSLFTGYNAKIWGWGSIEADDCEDVSQSGYETIALGFLQINASGVRGNPVYVVEDATRSGNAKWMPEVLCAPVNDRLQESSGIGIILERFSPPCKAGFAELRMSFGVKPGGSAPTINLTPKASDQLVSWPVKTAQAHAAPAQKPDNGMSDLEILARVIAGAADGLQKGKIRKLVGVCENSVLTFAFAFSKEGPAVACECIAGNIVRRQPDSTVERMLADVDTGKDFDTVYGHITESDLEAYMESCLTPVH